SETRLPGGAVDGVIVVAPGQRAVVVLGGGAVPAAVAVLVAGEPVERALHRLLADWAGPGALGQLRAVGIEPRPVGRGPLTEPATGRRCLRLGKPGQVARDDPRQGDRRRGVGRPLRHVPLGTRGGVGARLLADLDFGQRRFADRGGLLTGYWAG